MSALPITSTLPCSVDDPDIWFADPGTQAEEYAKKLCAVCPRRRPCLDVALENREPHGVWGGYTTDERVGMRKRGQP